MQLRLAMVPIAFLLLVATIPSTAFDSRLSIGDALDSSNFTMRTEYPASVGEQLHIFQFPFKIYGKHLDQIKIYSNGFIVLGNHSFEMPLKYPSQTAYSKHRLSDLEGDFIGVFTTVNQCSSNGKIVIRDLDVNEVGSDTCVGSHISRIENIINTAAPDANTNFVADYVLSVTWQGMSCIPRSPPLANTFTLALLRMNEKSYAVFQYEDIQWTADHSTSSLPPEAGIFIQGIDTPQLPRNNMHIEPNVWNDESNIAVPGEWLFPLHEGPIDVDIVAQSKIRTTTENFLESSEENCPNLFKAGLITFSSGAPPINPTYSPSLNEILTSDAADDLATQTKFAYDKMSTEMSSAVSDEQHFRSCDNKICKDSMANCLTFDGRNCCVCPPTYYGGGDEGCWSIAPERPRRVYLDGQLVINLAGASEEAISIFLDTEVRQGDNTISQSGIHNIPQNLTSVYLITPVFNVLNSFLALPQSKDNKMQNSRLFNIFSLTGGFSSLFEFTFDLEALNHGRLVIRGSLQRLSSTEDTFRGALNMEVTAEGQFTPLSSRLVGSDGLLQTDNALDRSIKYEKSGEGKVKFESQTFNMISEEGVPISVKIHGSGQAAAEKGACLLTKKSLLSENQKIVIKMGSQGYCREDCRPDHGCSIYCVDMPVYTGTTDEPCANIRCGRNAYCSNGYCYCESGYEGDANTECKPTSSEPCANIRCGRNAYCSNGYCYCESGYEGDANTECKPTSSEPCANIHCGRNAYCSSGYCYCESGYEGDANTECKPTSSESCQGVRCGLNAHCASGRCFCDHGYDGDANYECRLTSLTEPCSNIRCGENANCVRGQCKCPESYYGDPYQFCKFIGGDKPSSNPKCRPSIDAGTCLAIFRKYGYNSQTGLCEQFIYTGCQGNENRFDTRQECEKECGVMQSNSCERIRCGYNAQCVDGQCLCESGFTGDPYYECKSEVVDRCREVMCGRNAQCIDGHCECLPGYEGDPQLECRTGENCKGQRCGLNSYCRDEVCHCETGYQGNPYSGCVRISDRCDGVQCASNAYCENGYCRCDSGYTGDGFVECHYQGFCANVQCGSNAHCVEGLCVCWPGYVGDPNRRCEPADDQSYCNGRRCGQNAVCDRDQCICKYSFEGDPYLGCIEIPFRTERCGRTYCHAKARCHNDVCFCEYGYVGDGVTVCKKVEEDLCNRVRCAENAECEAGLCQCRRGFKGDGFSECTPVEVDPSSCNGRYCGANTECHDGACQCTRGYVGDPYDICTRERPLPDSCYGIECGSNAFCQNGICVCYEGFEGEPNLACKPIFDSSCLGIRCGVNAYCTKGRCICRQGYMGEANQICYPEWDSPSRDLCSNLLCHQNATCSDGECHCNYGFKGDGFLDCWPSDPANLCDCGGFPTLMGSCSNGKCRCMPGFRVSRDNHCEECRGNTECVANAQCAYDEQIQHYRCVCDSGYIGDGAIACISGSVANRTEAAQCPVPCHQYATCDKHDGRCKCRPGFYGNGYTYCDFDCNQCLAEARCMPESAQCVCSPGYTGDGIRMCRSIIQGLLTLQIVKDSETVRLREGSGALALRCVLSGDVRNVQARWLTPGDVGTTDELSTHEGRELRLTINHPSPENSGLYVCQASRVSDTITVIVEPQQVQTKQLFLTSDNGILTLQTQDKPTAVAQIWHIAENNRHKRVALALDCKSDRLIYTSDGGHALRFGNASAARLSRPPELIFQDNYANFIWIAVDPVSGNIFAIDESQSRIVIVNPDRPNQVHTFKKFDDHGDSISGGIAVHPGLSLVYWVQVDNNNSKKRESVIMVASMADPERVTNITRVTGSPISISLAVTDDIAGSETTAGRLCWLQRRQLMPFSRTDIYCAQLETSGRAIHSKRLLKSFDINEEPSCGLIQDDHTILWTSLYKKVYRSLNPSSSTYVNGVCCSNGFQSMAVHNTCKLSTTNTCSYENGRCRYFCLPGGREMARVCRCPDDQPNCIAEYSESRFPNHLSL